jgi:PAS domain S-box-containing protein
VLIGWLNDVEHIKSVVPGFVAMNPLTAFCFVLGGLSLVLQCEPGISRRRRWAAIGCAVFLVTIATAKLLDYALDLKLGWDRILFAASLGDNEMAPNTALCFLLAGVSLTALDWVTRRGVWPVHATAAILTVIASTSLLGYGYGASDMYRVGTFIPMALNTAFSFFVLSVGILLSRPDRGMAKVLFHEGQGGMMARRLIVVGVFVPCALGWLRVLGQRAGFYHTEFGAAAMVAVTALIFTAAVLYIAKQLNESDDKNKLANFRLERQSQEIQDLYDNAPCGYHSLDSNGVFVAINETELQWLGYDREELLGKKKFSDVITPEGLSHFVENYQLFMQQGSVKDLEFELVRKDGTTFPVIMNSTAITAPDGTFIASRTTLFDATERKRMEDAMRSFNADLERGVAERTEQLRLSNVDLLDKSQENELFIYSVSHDLRSPLVNLQGFSQELISVSQQVRELVTAGQMPVEIESQTVRLIDEDMRRCLGFIQTSVGRLSGIIDALLRLSRAGRVEYDSRRVDVSATVTRIIESMSATIFDRGVEISVKSLSPAWGDATALEQIFANLIGNAVNYLDPARPCQIEVGCLPNEDNKNNVTYYVKDNGLGIAEAYHGKVFQALKRLHPKVASGEGIGLALVKRMVERHNGAIWFESVPNQGSTFYVRLPSPPHMTEKVPSPLPSKNDHESHRLGHTIS